ncbi:MAG: amino acid adenylation domain-containing protein [Vicinamibacterales bacterium]
MSRHDRVARLLWQDGIDLGTTADHLPHPCTDDRCAASLAQQRLWFLQQRHPGNTAYHIPFALRLEGPLDVARLERVLTAVAARHEALRTTLVAEGGLPVQHVHPPAAVRLTVVPAPDQASPEVAYRAAAAPVMHQPFELADGPGWRAALLRRAPEDHCLLLVFHHALFDGASAAVFGADLEAAWENDRAGASPILDLAATHQADFAAWQHVRNSLGHLDAHVDFWARALADPPDLDLGGDERAAAPTLSGGRARQVVAGSVMEGFARLAREERATPFIATLAAWVSWLRLRSGSDDLIVGTPSAGRTRVAFEQTVGMLTNTLPLRFDLRRCRTLRDVVRLARVTLTDAHAHEEAPLERVVQRLRASGVHRPLARTSFALVPQRLPAPQLTGLATSIVPVSMQGGRVDLGLTLSAAGDAWDASLEYSADRFSAGAAADALEAFLAFAAGVAASPDAPLEGPAHRPAHAGRSAGVVLSPVQLRVWLDQQRSPETPLYNVAMAMHLDGRVDAGAFTRAFARLVASNDALRLSFTDGPDGPRQHDGGFAGTVEHVSLGDAPHAAIDAWCQARAREPFDLSGPLFRSYLVSRDPLHHHWLLVQHHLITDGHSMRLLCERMAALYADECGGPAAEAQHPGFLDWLTTQPSAIDGSCGEPATRGPAAEPLAFFGRTPHRQTTHVTRTPMPLGHRRARALREAGLRVDGAQSGDHGIFLLTAAALVAHLFHMTGGRRFTIGVPYQNRRPHARAIAGLFMDVLPLTVTCAPSDSMQTLMARIRSALRAALRQARRARAGGTPVPDVLLNVHTTPLQGLPGCDAAIDWLHTGAERECLAVQLYGRASDDPALALDTHDDVFDDGQRRLVAAQLVRVIDQILEAPDRRVGELHLLDEHAREAEIAAGTGPREPAAPAQNVLEVIWSVAREAPDAVAVEAGERRVTYAELVDAASRVAAGLDARAVRPGDLVGISLPRSPEYVIAILGVLAAGAAYLPLDPSAPRARREQFVTDASAWLVIGEHDHDTTVGIGDLLAAAPATTRPAPADGGDLAYVIYTSGSTGVPRGVEVPHRALANYAAYGRATFGLRPGDRALQFAALTFDTAVEEIFPTLTAGATLVLRDAELPAAGAPFMARLAALGITVLNLPTAYWHLLADAGSPLPPGVRLVLVGGEAMQADRLAAWRARVSPTARLLNGYGPTEATVVATFAEIGDAGGTGGAGVSIGQPIWNVETHVLGACLEPVARGMVGELYIGGAGLALGYRRSPGQTAERFVPHPFGPPGARLYRTGDLARRRPDGALEFVGRADSQLKIRGYRIEPGEIERTLITHPAIRDAVVLAASRDEGQVLVGVVVGVEGASLSDTDVRAFLRSRLPEYFVPSELRQVEELPRTPHGKIDRDALGAAPGILLRRAGRGPASDTERRLHTIWSTLLGRDDIGADDSFFDLGGHSLNAAQLAARVSETFGVAVTLPAIFAHPTVAGLAVHVDSLVPDAAPRPGPADVTGPAPPGDDAPPMSFAQERMWLMEQLAPGTTQYVVGARIGLTGPLEAGALEAALRGLMARHPALRTSLSVEGGHGVQVVHADVTVELARKDVSNLDDPPAAAADLMRALLACPFDLSVAPLLRAVLVHTGPDAHELHVSCHHAIFDAWSGAVLVQELGALYAAARSGRPPDLPPAPPDYATFARRQREALTAEREAALVAYWREELDGAPELVLPADGPRGPADTCGDSTELVLGRADTAALRQLARAADATPFMVTAAATALVLGRLADQPDVVFGTPVAGRDHSAFERTIGCFLNTLVLRCDLSGNPTALDLVTRVRTSVLRAFAHQDLPFDRLVQALQPERAAGRPPFFDVMLNFLNTATPSAAFADLALDTRPTGTRDAKMGLTLYAELAHDELKLRAAWRTSQFSRPRMTALLRQIAGTLRTMTAAPRARVEDIALADTTPEAPLPVGTRPLPCHHRPTVVESFIEQVARHPTREALDDRGRPVSYDQLSRTAGAIARHLSARALAPGSHVAVAGSPGEVFVAAMLATWAAGHVAVPVDAALPGERALKLLETAQPAALIATEPLPAAWRGRDDVFEAHRDSLDTSGARLVCARSGEVREGTGDPAYVCFTSGTSGVPKGVLGSHQGLAHFLDWQARTYAVVPDDRVGQVTSPSFDVFLREAFLPLTCGATLVVPGGAEGATSGATRSWLRRAGITLLHAVPAMAQTWLDAEPDVPPLDALRVTFFAGEPLSRALVSRWRASAPATRVVNLYGPTETTLAKCAYEVPPAPSRDVMPIGRAMPGAEVLILRGGRPCGIGEPGEIVIRTPYRSLGYLGDEGRERFTTNPLTRDPDDIVYRTGDRGRYAPDGIVEIDGRYDEAVKVRGVRVDLGEVGAVLAGHPDVQAAVVMAGPQGDGTLTAYVVSTREIPPASLRRHVVATLPAAAVPTRIHRVPVLPLGPNGKVDRAALRTLDAAPLVAKPLRAPETPTERALAPIWREVLGTARVSRDDDFFEAGGHSLLAAQLVARVSRALGAGISIRTVFDAPTLAELAAAIDATATPGAARPEIPRADRRQYRSSVA